MDNFMKDRYGVDGLTTLLGGAGMVLALIGTLADIDPLMWASIVIVVIALLRAFSKNIDARRKENEAFTSFMAKIPGLSSLTDRLNASGSRGASSTRTPADRQARKAELERNKRLAKKMWKERKTSNFLKCPQCGQVLSVPKGKGKLRVTCPKCHAKMEVKS